MTRRLTLVLVALSLVAAACTSEGLPESYADQDGRAETQFIEACETSLVDGEQSDPVEFCQCAFHTVASELTYAEFVELDNKLKDDPEALSFEERQLLESVSLPCNFDESTVKTDTLSN
jgi:hypothetical protein